MTFQIETISGYFLSNILFSLRHIFTEHKTYLSVLSAYLYTDFYIIVIKFFSSCLVFGSMKNVNECDVRGVFVDITSGYDNVFQVASAPFLSPVLRAEKHFFLWFHFCTLFSWLLHHLYLTVSQHHLSARRSPAARSGESLHTAVIMCHVSCDGLSSMN